MIFQCMELFIVIFQVFNDFQSLWAPCKTISRVIAHAVQGLLKNIEYSMLTCEYVLIEGSQAHKYGSVMWMKKCGS